MGLSQLEISTLPRLLAVEVLLAEPEALDDDVLESCLYLLREKLTGNAGPGAAPHLTGCPRECSRVFTESRTTPPG